MSQKTLAKGSDFPPLKKDTLRVYSMRFCPYAQRARLVLAHKRIPHETINVHLVNKPDWLLERNPDGKVPVLEYNDKVLYESGICADYLDEIYPQNPLNPKDSYIKARHNMLKEHFSKWISLYYKLLLTKDVDKVQTLADMHKVLEKMEEELGDNKFYGGSVPAMLDLHIWPWFERLAPYFADMDMVPKGKFPRLAAWIDNMWATDAVKATAFDAKTHNAFKDSYATGNIDYDIGLE